MHVAGAQTVENVPGRERPQHPAVLGIVDGRDECVGEVHEPGEVFVAFGERAGGDEHAPQVLDGHAGWFGVERGVRQWLFAAGDLSEQVGAAATGQPA